MMDLDRVEGPKEHEEEKTGEWDLDWDEYDNHGHMNAIG